MPTSTLENAAADEFVHPALFYRGTEEYLEGTLSFIRQGLAAEEPVAVAVPGSNLRLILAELGVDAQQVTALDMTRVGRNPGRIIPGVLLAFADAHPAERVRIIGEPIWAGRSATEYPACVQHEALINLAFEHRRVTILCPYDVERLSPGVLADAEATHPVLIDSCGTRASVGYAPQRVVADYNLPLPAPSAPFFSFDAGTLAQVRRFASQQATRLGLSVDHTELELIVGELTANSVAHGGGGGTMSIWAEEDHLVCEVRDGGRLTDPLAGRRPADRHQLHGRGLLLVNYLGDLVRIYTSPECTTVRVYLALPMQAGHPVKPSARTSTARPALNRRVGRGGSPDRAPLRRQTHDAVQSAARFARYLPPDSAPSLKPEAERSQLQPVLEALVAADVLAQVVDLWRARLVSLARYRGGRWTDIGHALGVSKQAAHERYGGRPRRATSRRTGPDHLG